MKKESYSRLPYHCFMNVSTFAITCFVSHNLFTTAVVCGKESFCSERLVTPPGSSISVLFFSSNFGFFPLSKSLITVSQTTIFNFAKYSTSLEDIQRAYK